MFQQREQFSARNFHPRTEERACGNNGGRVVAPAAASKNQLQRRRAVLLKHIKHVIHVRMYMRAEQWRAARPQHGHS